MLLNQNGKDYNVVEIINNALANGSVEFHNGIWLATGDFLWENSDDFIADDVPISDLQCHGLWLVTKRKFLRDIRDKDELAFLIRHPQFIDKDLYPA